MAVDSSNDTLVIKRLLNANVQTVFQAFSDPAIMSQWFYATKNGSSQVTNSLEVGGVYKVIMQHDDGSQSIHSGKYREIDPPHRLVFTWDLDEVGETIVSIQFTAKGNQTEIILMHDLLPNQQSRDMHSFGWNACIDTLTAYLASN